MKYLWVTSILVALSGCDISSYFNDTKKNVKSYICEASSISKLLKKSGETEFKESEIKHKDKENSLPLIFNFTLTEYYAPYFSKNREKNHTYYELRSFNNNEFRQKLTINVWPAKKDGFTSIQSIEDGYAAFITKDEVTFRRNTEQVKVTDGFISARMWDYFHDLDTFLDWISTPETREEAKIALKDKQYPFDEFVGINLNRVSGAFKYEELKYYGEENKPDTRKASKIIYEGYCRAGLNL